MSKLKVGDKVNLIVENKIRVGEIFRAEMQDGVEGYTIRSFECWDNNFPVWRAEKQISAIKLVKIPQFVADQIEEDKKGEYPLCVSIYNIIENLDSDSDLSLWLMDVNNQHAYAKAWIDGYEVEKEQLYYVRILKDNVRGFLNQLNSDSKNSLFIAECTQSTHSKTQFTEQEVMELEGNFTSFMVPIEEVDDYSE